MNAHEAIVSAVRAALLVDPPLAGGNVVRARQRPVSEGVNQFIAVYFAGSAPNRGTIYGAPIDWATNVRFDCYARGAVGQYGTEGQSGDQAALALHAEAWNRLFSAPTLGGLAMDMAPLPIPPSDEDEIDTTLGVVSGGVQLRHRTGGYTLEI